jgi:hypothetical protein
MAHSLCLGYICSCGEKTTISRLSSRERLASLPHLVIARCGQGHRSFFGPVEISQLDRWTNLESSETSYETTP